MSSPRPGQDTVRVKDMLWPLGLQYRCGSEVATEHQ